MIIRIRDPFKKCKCEECGKTFIRKTPTQKYCCDECRIKVGIRQNRLYKKSVNKKTKHVVVKPKKKIKIKKKISFGLYTRHR